MFSEIYIENMFSEIYISQVIAGLILFMWQVVLGLFARAIFLGETQSLWVLEL